MLEETLCTNIVYYNDDHSKTTKCSSEIKQTLNITFTTPSTWLELVGELEQGCKFLAFHVDMISRSVHSTPIEFIDAINTITRFIPQSKNLKIGVIIKTTTPASMIRTLQKSGVQGILLDINYYAVEEVSTAVNALINNIPYWPKHIINQLPGNVKSVVAVGRVVLTNRQSQILRFITERGSSNKVIAKSLGISESTVKLHVSKIFKKYGVRNRTQLAVFNKEDQVNQFSQD